MKEFGKPVFCKIDAEGYEYKVLKGLSEPIDLVSFEFTPTSEFIDSAINAIRYLSDIGKATFNYTRGEPLSFALKKWGYPMKFLI